LIEEKMNVRSYQSSLSLSILNILAFIGVVIVNALANALPINGVTTGELSDRYPNLFVPAGLTFSIWGLIYLLLALFVIYQLIAVLKKDEEGFTFTKRIGPYFFISCIANIGWIFAWHYSIVPLSLLLMLVLLGSLIMIYTRLQIGRSRSSGRERFMVHMAFSIYLGWITVATIANVTALLVDSGLRELAPGAQFWTVLVIIVAIAIALIALVNRRDLFYTLVVDWALLGILLKRLDVTVQPVYSVVITSIAGIAILTVGIIIWLIRRKVY
jgi:hypothetical protein